MTTPEDTQTTQGTKPTDVAEFITDLEGGRFEKILSIGLSQAAGSCVANAAKSVMTIEFSFEHIGGSQVQCSHKMLLTTPTARGSIKEDDKGVTGLYVGAGGQLSLLPHGIDYMRQDNLPIGSQKQGSKATR